MLKEIRAHLRKKERREEEEERKWEEEGHKEVEAERQVDICGGKEERNSGRKEEE